MKRIIIPFLLPMLMILALGGCNRDDLGGAVGASRWKVERLRKAGAVAAQDAKEDYFLRFDPPSSYSVSLDINSCGGDYSMESNGAVSFTQPGCTEACCDTDFALDLVALLPAMRTYAVSGDVLQLEGDGMVKLVRAD